MPIILAKRLRNTPGAAECRKGIAPMERGEGTVRRAGGRSPEQEASDGQESGKAGKSVVGSMSKDKRARVSLAFLGRPRNTVS